MEFKSNEIQIFPVSNRLSGESSASISEYGKLGKLNIEQNIIKPYNSILDNNKIRLSGENITINKSTLFLPESEYLIDGYYIKIQSATYVDLKSYVPTPSTHNINYNIYIQLKLSTSSISQNLSIAELDGKDIGGKYTGIDLIITTEFLVDNATTYNLLLGQIEYKNSTWSKDITPNELINYKFTFNNMGIDMTGISGLSSDSPNNINDWLENNFIIDDGEI